MPDINTQLNDTKNRVHQAASKTFHIRPPAPIPRENWGTLPGVLWRMYANPIKAWAKIAYTEKIVDRSHWFLKLYFVHDPDALKHLLATSHKKYELPNTIRRILGELVPESLVVLEGKKWQKLRQVLAPLFRSTELDKFIGNFADSAQSVFGDFPENSGKTTDISSAASLVSIRALNRTFFSDTAELERMELDLLDAISYMRDEAGQLDLSTSFNLPQWFPTLRRSAAKRALKPFRKIVFELLDNMDADQQSGKNLIEHMAIAIKSHENLDTKNRKNLIFDNVALMYAAGQETSASTLHAAIYLLSTHPEVQELAHQEIDQILGKTTIDEKTIPQLTLINAIINETMRLYPPIPHLGRTAVDADVLCDTKIPKGSIVFYSPFILHRHEKLWENVDLFDPSRFITEGGLSDFRWKFMPFGDGPRKCIGQGFAMRSIVVTLTTWLQKYRFELADDKQYFPMSKVTLQINPNIEVRIFERNN